MSRTFFLKHASVCRGCDRRLAVGARAHLGVKGQNQGVRCAACGPFPLPEGPVEHLRAGTAEGAEDSRSKPMMTKAMARAYAMTKNSEQPPKKRVNRSRNRKAAKRAK